MKSFEINYTSDKKIYITRNDALTRRVVNEQEVIEELTKIGFEIFSLEGLSIVDQAKLFSMAKIVVAPHGAGLTNLDFL
jgi:capsular polysaccharide biosynthesis protein